MSNAVARFFIKQIELPGDNTLLLKNDDWGHYIMVIDKDENILYNGPIIINDREDECRIAEVVEVFTQLHDRGVL